MKFALALVFSNFNVTWRFEGGMAAQITLGLIAAGVLLYLGRKYGWKCDKRLF